MSSLMPHLPADARFEPGRVNRLSEHVGVVIELEYERITATECIHQMRR